MNIEKTMESLKKNGYEVSVFNSATEAADYLNQSIDGKSVGFGGSITLQDLGIYDMLAEHNTCHWHWPKSGKAMPEVVKAAADADIYLTSVNALSENGEMVNIDGTGNRVAAIVYGPKEVIVIAGMNKVMDTLEDAITRARTVAAPLNQQRFGLPNPCTTTGTCADCKSETCICNQILITRHCRPVGRIKFILVGEDLGL